MAAGRAPPRRVSPDSSGVVRDLTAATLTGRAGRQGARFGGAMSTIGCAQCGRPLPSDAAELARWKNGTLAAAGELDETTAAMLLCPECADEERVGAFEEGEAG